MSKNCPKCTEHGLYTDATQWIKTTQLKEIVGYVKSETGKTFVPYSCPKCGYTEFYLE